MCGCLFHNTKLVSNASTTIVLLPLPVHCPPLFNSRWGHHYAHSIPPLLPLVVPLRASTPTHFPCPAYRCVLSIHPHNATRTPTHILLFTTSLLGREAVVSVCGISVSCLCLTVIDMYCRVGSNKPAGVSFTQC